MEKDKEFNSYNHCINVIERKNILISGVKKVASFDKEEFLLETVMGYLAIKGEDLELVKLDTLQGSVNIKGIVNSMDYFDDNSKKENASSIFTKLFK